MGVRFVKFLLHLLVSSCIFLVAQLVKYLPAMWETWVWSLGWEDPMEKGKATHSSILAWTIPGTVQSMGPQRVGHDWVTFTFTFPFWSIDVLDYICWFSNVGRDLDTWDKSHLVVALVLQSHSCIRLYAIQWTAAKPGFPVLHHLLELAQTHVHWIGDAIQPCCPLSSSLSAFNLSQHQGLFQWVSSSYQWPKYWSLSFSISSSKEYSGLISFRIYWFDLAVQGTLKSLLQHHSSKASIFQHSALWCNSHIHTWLLEKP